MIQKLREALANTTKAEFQREWAEIQAMGLKGPTVSELLAYQINTEWLLFGTGEMLKFEKTEEKISPAALVQEGIYITKNLPALHRESGQSAAALSLQCGVPEHIFHSPSQEGGASYPFSVIDLARISRALDVPLDVLFFWDLSNPETMRDYQEHKQNTQAILESAATKKEVEELRRIIQEQGEKIEKILENYRELIEGLKK